MVDKIVKSSDMFSRSNSDVGTDTMKNYVLMSKEMHSPLFPNIYCSDYNLNFDTNIFWIQYKSGTFLKKL